MRTFKETQPKHREYNRPYMTVSTMLYLIPFLGLAVGVVFGIEWLQALGVIVVALIVLKFLSEIWIRLYIVQYREKHKGDLLT